MALVTKVGRNGRVVVKDHGMAAIERNAPKLDGWGVKVGILSSAPAPDGAGDMTLAAVASVHEYGSDNTPAPIPERSFLRSSVDEKGAEIDRRMAAGQQQIEAGQPPDVVLGRIGLWFQSVVQAKITAGPFVPLSDYTIERKGSSVPLIDTGRMRGAVAFEVVPPSGDRGAT